jgi:CRISPR-associated endonuclease/helicase Cas3
LLADSQVYVFQSPDWKVPPELAQLAAPMRSILRTHEGDVLAPVALKSYFQQVYYAKGADLDYYKILTKIRDTGACDFPFQDIARNFRMIESNMLPIIVPFDDMAKDNLELLGHLPENMSVGKIAQKLQRYVVQVPERAFVQLLKLGAVAVVAPEKFGNQFYELIAKDLWYSTHAGLDLEPTGFDASACVN